MLTTIRILYHLLIFLMTVDLFMVQALNNILMCNILLFSTNLTKLMSIKYSFKRSPPVSLSLSPSLSLPLSLSLALSLSLSAF